MNLDTVVTVMASALKAPATPAWVEVRKARVAENFIGEAGASLPVGLVHHWKVEAGEAHYMTGGFRQTTFEQFAVVIICAESQLDTRRNELMLALLGNELSGFSHLIQYVGGQLFELNAETCAWREVFQVQIDRRTP